MSVKTPPDIIKKIEKVAGFASLFDPFHAAYPFTQANTAWFLNNLERSRTHFIDSIRLDPLNSRHLNRFASFLSQQGESGKARIAFKNSMIYDKSNAEYAFQYGAWLLAQKNFKQGVEYMKKTLALNEKYFDRVLTSMIVSGANDYDMEQAIPDLPGPTIEYANFLSNTGSMREAISKYLIALDLIDILHNQTVFIHKHSLVKIRSFYYKIFSFFKTRNDLKNAMEVMERAEKTLPMDARIKVTLGDLYYQQGILYKAFDKYDHALLLEPGNKRALKMMQKLNP